MIFSIHETGNGDEMKYVIALLLCATYLQDNALADSSAAAAAAATSSSGQSVSFAPTKSVSITCRCQYIFKPVCGSDGNTYSNECILRCVSYENIRNGRPPIYVVLRRECPQEDCVCTTEVDPVCGTDGVTYSNGCQLGCENRRRARLGLTPIGIRNAGPCRTTRCVCSSAVIPVCGNNGRTYRNICFLQCANRANQEQGLPEIRFRSRGACVNENCNCPTYYRPVCASNGRTYYNRCYLDCTNRRRNALGFYALYVQFEQAC